MCVLANSLGPEWSRLRADDWAWLDEAIETLGNAGSNGGALHANANATKMAILRKNQVSCVMMSMASQ